MPLRRVGIVCVDMSSNGELVQFVENVDDVNPIKKQRKKRRTKCDTHI